MAFQLYVSVDDVTTQLNDGAPFRLESAHGLSGAGVTRLGQRGPLQSGVSDLGYRLRPRAVMLALIFTAPDDATLDAYRDQLITAFKPLENISIFLSVRRDDDEIRTLTCYTTAEISITLTPELRPGHTHRATVQLRAAYPLYKANAVTVGSASFDQWWLAGGALGTAVAVEPSAVEFPAENFAKSIRAGGIPEDWSVAFVTSLAPVSPPADVVAYGVWGNDYPSGTRFAFWRSVSPFGTSTYKLGGVVPFINGGAGTVTLGTTWPGGTTDNLHIIEQRSNTIYWRYWDGSALAVHTSVPGGTATFDAALRQIFAWRTDNINDTGTVELPWQTSLARGVVLVAPTTGQLDALAPYMLGLQGTPSIVNGGDVYAYPVITLQGPFNDPVITNQTTGQVIDLTGGTIGQGDTWTVDLRDGNKQIYNQSGTNMLGNITSMPIAMADFAIAPHPVVAGGTNAMTLSASNAGSAAVFAVQITNEYTGF
jgi:hypothetical protein